MAAPRRRRLLLAIPAIAAGLGCCWLAWMLAGLGLFCFDGSLSLSFSDPLSRAPDCSLARMGGWINPKFWLVANLLGTAVLGMCAGVVAYGVLRHRAWAKRLSLAGIVAGIALFAELGGSLHAVSPT